MVWAHCATGTLSGVWRSTAGRARWQPANGSAAGGVAAEQPNSAAFGSASATTAIVGYRQLYRTGDGGRSYTAVGPAGVTRWQHLGFTDPTHGVALGSVGSSETPSNERLYYTTDGGVSYHLVPIP